MKLIVPPPVQGLIMAVAMWTLARQTPGLTVDFPGRALLVYLLGLVGVAMEIIAGLMFLRARTTPNPLKPQNASKLVTSGLYGFSRNPMYLALLFVLVAWGLHLANPLNVLLLVGWVIYITEFQIKPEEQALKEKFAADYDDYCRRVRRWL
jgi:protein-S-isoprenylcysteine O-methyltransferase Ste14